MYQFIYGVVVGIILISVIASTTESNPIPKTEEEKKKEREKELKEQQENIQKAKIEMMNNMKDQFCKTDKERE